MIKYLIYVAVGFFCTACHFQAEPARTTLAQIGNMTIQSKDFVYFHTDFLRRSGASDNLQFRNQFLESEIDRKVFLMVGDSLEWGREGGESRCVEVVGEEDVLDGRGVRLVCVFVVVVFVGIVGVIIASVLGVVLFPLLHLCTLMTREGAR